MTESIEDSLWITLRTMDEKNPAAQAYKRAFDGSGQGIGGNIYAKEAGAIAERSKRVKEMAMENGNPPLENSGS